MEPVTKPVLLLFRFKVDEHLSKFIWLHWQQDIKCLAQFFHIIEVSEDCDYQEVCDKYEPDLALFECGKNYRATHRLTITNTHTHSQIPKLGLHIGDSWCEARSGLFSDLEHWGIETFFSISTTMAELSPEVTDKVFSWPNYVDADLCHDYGQEKIIPVMLTGRLVPLYPWRQKICPIIAQNYPSLICPHLGYESSSTFKMLFGEKYYRAINSSWVVPTCGTAASEILRKHFEIPACKSCLITERTPVVEAAGFVDMQNCVFADDKDVLDKLDYLFEHQDTMETITNAGYELVHARHTLKNRDQIFQWFKLQKNLQSNQKIVQDGPFGSIYAAEKSSNLSGKYIICNGLINQLLGEAYSKLWTHKYDEAEGLYIKCYDHISWMPEPKLGLALCNLYKGNATEALRWILEPIRYTLEEYKAIDPDPVEWAYLIIALLCKGKLEQATKCSEQFPSLCHPELERVRWVISILKKDGGGQDTNPTTKSVKRRYSVHQLPERNFDEWIEHVCSILKACNQFQFKRSIKRSMLSENRVLGQESMLNGKAYLPTPTKSLSQEVTPNTMEALALIGKIADINWLEQLSVDQRIKVKLERVIKKAIIKPIKHLKTKMTFNKSI